MRAPMLSGVERFFSSDEIIVSKTDARGRIIYANEVFLRLSGYREGELLGRPHSIIRHPLMPRCVFRLLWETIGAGRECFAYVCNLAKTGDHYWVLAHVTPTLAADGRIVSYHSNRRCPRREAVAKAAALYAELSEIEASHADTSTGLQAASQFLHASLAQQGVSYEEFVFGL